MNIPKGTGHAAITPGSSTRQHPCIGTSNKFPKGNRQPFFYLRLEAEVNESSAMLNTNGILHTETRLSKASCR